MGEFIVSLVAIGAVLGIGAAFDSYSCSAKTQQMNKHSSWGPVQGCMIQTKDGYVPLESYRVIN